MNIREIMKNGLWEQNIVFSQILGMCPTMAVSMSTKVGSAMSWPNVGRASASMRPYAARLPVRAVPAVAGSDDCGSGVCTCTL